MVLRPRGLHLAGLDHEAHAVKLLPIILQRRLIARLLRKRDEHDAAELARVWEGQRRQGLDGAALLPARADGGRLVPEGHAADVDASRHLAARRCRRTTGMLMACT